MKFIKIRLPTDRRTDDVLHFLSSLLTFRNVDKAPANNSGGSFYLLLLYFVIASKYSSVVASEALLVVLLTLTKTS